VNIVKFIAWCDSVTGGKQDAEKEKTRSENKKARK
jgi:hypothetical protein